MDGQNNQERRHVGAVVGRVLRTPLSWATWAGAGFVWLIFGEAGVPLADSGAIALGSALAVHAGIVAVLLRDPQFMQPVLRAYRMNEARRRLNQVRDDTANMEARTRERIHEILTAYEALCRESAAPDVPRYARAPLAAAVAQMGRLAAQASHLATRRGELAAYLEGVNRSELHGRQASLRARHEHADDPVLKEQLEQSLRFKSEEIYAYDAILLAMSRIDGQLESVECAFAALKARVLRFKSDEKTEWSAAGEQLREEIDALSTQMRSLDDAVREVVALRRI